MDATVWAWKSGDNSWSSSNCTKVYLRDHTQVIRLAAGAFIYPLTHLTGPICVF